MFKVFRKHKESEVLEEELVHPGLVFIDEKHNRELTVYKQCSIDSEYWYCSVPTVEVLYRYHELFILENLI